MTQTGEEPLPSLAFPGRFDRENHSGCSSLRPLHQDRLTDARLGLAAKPDARRNRLCGSVRESMIHRIQVPILVYETEFVNKQELTIAEIAQETLQRDTSA
jgi:hypothetical protein